ncbi:uncharacterized protein LOC142579788 isoform X2 [Dermacentor variabilis]|uniref:uncharacterized protein LOC142579788 isoform X2 n=1 Tax=Dermacentor variabilis TaxID=34621 RepID=UPI003F5B2B2E
MKACALAVLIVGTIVGGAGQFMGDIYGVAMAPVVDTTITHPELVKGGTNKARCNQCSCKIAWELRKYEEDGRCKDEFEFTCTCNSYRCDKKETQLCMHQLAANM